MKQRFHIAAVIAAAFISTAAWGNGDPVIEYSAVRRSANPVPMTISEIRVAAERLRIIPGLPWTRVIVEYDLVNDSNRNFEKINYGFPIDYIGDSKRLFLNDDGMTESMTEAGWSESNLKDVSFSFKGRELEWSSADETIKIAKNVTPEDDPEVEVPYFDPGLTRLWTYTAISMGPRDRATLRVAYSIRSRQLTGVYDKQMSQLGRYYAKELDIHYDLKPAKHWGDGKAGSLDVAVDFSGLPAFVDDQWDWPRLEGLDFQRDGNVWTYHSDSFDYASAEPIDITSWCDESHNRKPWTRIDSLKIEKDLYIVTTTRAQEKYPTANMVDGLPETTWVSAGDGSKAKVIIDFKIPQNVSDIRLLNGYHKSHALLKANSRLKRVRLSIYRLDKNEPEVFDLDLTGDQRIYTDAKEWDYGAYREPVGIVITPEEYGDITGRTVERIVLEVLEVEKGTKYTDLCISEIEIYGQPEG